MLTGQGGQVRLPGHQRHLDADAARGPARIRRGRERRHHADLDRRCRVPGRPAQQGHGDRRRRARRVRAHRGRQVRHHGRPAHRPLPQGQAGRLRPPAARDLRRARRQGPEPAVPVAHVGRLRRDAGRQPGHRPGAAGPGRRRQDHPRGRDHPDRRRGGRRLERDQRELYASDTTRPHHRGAGPGEKGRYLLAATFGNVHGVYKPGNVRVRRRCCASLQDADRQAVRQEGPVRLRLPRRLRLQLPRRSPPRWRTES